MIPLCISATWSLYVFQLPEVEPLCEFPLPCQEPVSDRVTLQHAVQGERVVADHLLLHVQHRDVWRNLQVTPDSQNATNVFISWSTTQIYVKIPLHLATTLGDVNVTKWHYNLPYQCYEYFIRVNANCGLVKEILSVTSGKYGLENEILSVIKGKYVSTLTSKTMNCSHTYDESILRSVVFPSPFLPHRPYRLPAAMCRDASVISTLQYTRWTVNTI